MLGFARRRFLFGLALAVGAALLVAFAPAPYWADMKTMFDSQDVTRQERIRSWEQAQAAWRDNPVLGVGPGNVPWVLARYEKFDTRVSHSLGGRAVHSLYLTILAEFGLVGVVLYGAAVVLLVARCVGIVRGPELPGLHAESCARAIICSLVAWLVGGAFLSVLYYPHLYFLIALAIATRGLQAGAGVPDIAARRRPWATRLALPAAAP
jgi:O-antigen ligase